MRYRSILALLLVFLIGFILFSDRLIGLMLFRPTAGAPIQPERLGLRAEGVWLESGEGVRIHAYWLPVEGAEKAILYLHGNGGNASLALPTASEILRFGASVLVLDYRGYGLSEGAPSEEGVYQDARAGLAYLMEVQGFPEDRIIVMGQSLGGAIAVDLAQDRELAGLVLESTFDSLANAFRLRLPFVKSLLSGRFESDRKILRVKSPVLFIHGDLDETVPRASGERLFALAPEPRDFLVVPGAGHNDVSLVGGRVYFDRLGDFIGSVGAR